MPASSLGYRCAGFDADRWTAVHIPHTNQVWVNPFQHPNATRSALVEEFVHATTISLQPAQLYPLANYLLGANVVPGIIEFSDLVETIYLASWPLAKDKPVLARSLPPSHDDLHDHARQVLHLARRFAAHRRRSPGSKAARQEALWALVMFLLHVVPLGYNVCPAVLDSLSATELTTQWRSYPDLFNQVFQAMLTISRTGADGKRPFSLVLPNEPHRRVTVMLQYLDMVLNATGGGLLPLLPTVLAIATLDGAGFLPLIHLRRRGRTVFAGIEFWDQTPQKSRKTAEVIESRRALHARPSSGIADCPIDQFFRDHFDATVAAVRIHRTSGPAEVLKEVLDGLPRRVAKYLIPLWKRGDSGCRLCGLFTRDPEVRYTVEHVLGGLSHKRVIAIVDEMRGYEPWLWTTGLAVVRVELERSFGWEGGVEPMPMKDGSLPMVWRPL